MIESPVRPFTGRHMLLIMLAFFATVVTANMTLVYFANHSWTGLVVKNSYVASQEFNATTLKLEQAAANIHSVVEFKSGKLSVSLTDKGGSPVAASNVTVKLGRPSHEGEDQVIALTAIGNGVFAGDRALAKGQWAGDVSADIPGHPKWQRPVKLLVME